MGLTKTIERKGKRFLILLATRFVRTKPASVETVLAAGTRRILTVRQHNQMGDMLLSIPAYRAIKNTFGEVELGVVTAPINRDVLLNSPYVDKVFTYNNRNLPSTIRMLRNIRRERYDIVIVLHTVSFSFTSALIGLLSGARYRVGSTSDPFGNSLGESFYHLELPLPSAAELERMNEAEHNLYPLRALGIDTEDLSPLLVPTAMNESFAREFLGRSQTPGGIRIAVHPGAGKKENTWRPENFAEVINHLGRRADIDVCVIEGPRDAKQIARFARTARVPYNLLLERSIGDVAAVLKRMDLVLCNDTGVMHVSCAVGAGTLAVFGPTDPARWAPRCSNLSVIRAPHGDLSRLSVEVVYEKVLATLGLADQP